MGEVSDSLLLQGLKHRFPLGKEYPRVSTVIPKQIS